jgi:hypothetical protein
VTEWMTPTQIAKQTGRGVNRVRLALECGELHGHQRVRGGRWLVDPACVDPWLVGLDSKTACCCRNLRVAARRSA